MIPAASRFTIAAVTRETVETQDVVPRQPKEAAVVPHAMRPIQAAQREWQADLNPVEHKERVSPKTEAPSFDKRAVGT